MPSFSRFFKHIFGSLIWLSLLFLVVILYHYSVQYVSWQPHILAKIDMLYKSIKIFLCAWFVASVINLIVYKIKRSRVTENRILKRFLPIINFVVNLLVWVVAGFMILEACEINTKNILTGAGIGGAILALAYKDLFTNLLGSLSILFSQNFEIGDTIRIRTVRLWVEWMVEEITLHHTKITNKTGEVVYVPNKVIYSESVENLSKRRFFTYEFSVPFAKSASSQEISDSLRIIEGKINSFYPLKIEYVMSSPNAADFMYTIFVSLPKENSHFENEMRNFLVKFIFRGENKPKNTENPVIVSPKNENESEEK